MEAKLGDVLSWGYGKGIYLVVKSRAGKLHTVCLGGKTAKDAYVLQDDEGAWTYNSSIKKGHTTIIGNILEGTPYGTAD